MEINQKEIDQLTKAVEHLNSENAELMNSLSSAKQQMLSQETTLQEQTQQIADLQRSHEALEFHFHEEQSRWSAEQKELLHSKEDENHHLTIAVTNLNRELEACRAENDELVAELQTLQSSDVDFREREKKLQGRVDGLLEEIEKHKRRELELKELIEKCNQNYDVLQSELHAKENEIHSLQAIVATEQTAKQEVLQKEEQRQEQTDGLLKQIEGKEEEIQKVGFRGVIHNSYKR